MNKCEGIASFEEYPHDAVFISAKEGLGIDRLKQKILAHFAADFSDLYLFIPYARMDEYARIRDLASEKDLRYRDDGISLTARVPKKYAHKFAAFQTGPAE